MWSPVHQKLGLSIGPGTLYSGNLMASTFPRISQEVPNFAFGRHAEAKVWLSVSQKFPNMACPGHVVAYHGPWVSQKLQAGMSEAYSGNIMVLSFPRLSKTVILEAYCGYIMALSFPKSSPTWHLGSTLWQHDDLDFPGFLTNLSSRRHVLTM